MRYVNAPDDLVFELLNQVLERPQQHGSPDGVDCLLWHLLFLLAKREGRESEFLTSIRNATNAAVKNSNMSIVDWVYREEKRSGKGESEQRERAYPIVISFYQEFHDSFFDD